MRGKRLKNGMRMFSVREDTRLKRRRKKKKTTQKEIPLSWIFVFSLRRYFFRFVAHPIDWLFRLPFIHFCSVAPDNSSIVHKMWLMVFLFEIPNLDSRFSIRIAQILSHKDTGFKWKIRENRNGCWMNQAGVNWKWKHTQSHKLTHTHTHTILFLVFHSNVLFDSSCEHSFHPSRTSS